MRARLARALGDPTLELAYRLGDGRYVDAEGRAIELPRQADRAVTALTAGGEEIAVLVHDPALLDEPGLVESVRATAGLVLENERLAAEVRSQLAEVRASRGRIVAAGDAERRRIERNLHDGAQQRLVTLSMALGLEASRADAAQRGALSRAQDEIEQAIAELRELARGIHPTLLRDEGLEAAVVSLARRTPAARHRATARSRRGSRTRSQLAAYFVVAESLTNVVKHASATEASVELDQDEGTLRVTVARRWRRRRLHLVRVGPRRPSRPPRRTRRDARDRQPGRGGHDRPRRLPMRVVIADDAPLIREGIAALLAEHGVEVVQQVGDADALLDERSRPAPGRGADRHPDAADPHRRRPSRCSRDPCALSRHRRARALAGARARVRAPARRGEARRGRVPLEGTRRSRRAAPRCDRTRRGR